MMDRYLVKITDQAQKQLGEIVDYITLSLQQPITALRLLDKLEEAILSLANLPKRVALTEEEPWAGHGIRKMAVKNFLIYFWINELEKKVQVVAVIYAKRNQAAELERLDID